MVEEILQWLKNISIFLIFMTTVLNLIPEKEDKKPVQFFLGIVMVLIFFQPVLKAGGLEQKMAQTLDRLTLEEEAAAMENVQIRAESFEKQYYVGAWEKETERQIRMYLSESGIPGAAVSVTRETPVRQKRSALKRRCGRRAFTAKNRKNSGKCSMKS